MLRQTTLRLILLMSIWVWPFDLLALDESNTPVSEKSVYSIFTLDPERPSIQISQRILTLAYAQLGIPVRFVVVPVLRSLVMWNNGNLDSVSFRLLDDGWPLAIKIPVPIVFEETVVFTKKPGLQVRSYADLANYTVGYLGGVPILEERLRDLPKTDAARSLDSLFKKLDAGRTDLVIDSRYSLCVVKRLGLNKVYVLEPGLGKRLGYHIIHQRHAKLAQPLERVLRQMESDGTIRRIQDEVIHEYQQNCLNQSNSGQP